ncbi:glycosyltransferase family 2 protein [Lachnospiraceae bacterium C1.1]|nr:glycosyltransferase family 2 protein [Lachnospiraceae bacterium C1.1]
MKKVSCIITSYKREGKILRRALRSVLEQTWENIEVLVVDDNRGKGSEVYSEEIMKITDEAGDKVRYLKSEEPRGAQAARNTGIKNATGEYVAFLDDDDEWMPEKIKKQVELMEKETDAGLCYCDGFRVNDNTNPPTVKRRFNIGFKTRVSYKDMLSSDEIGSTSQAMIRKKVFDEVGGFDLSFPARQDYEMWLRITKKYPAVGINEPLFKYHVGANGQVSKNWKKCIEGHELLYRKYKADIDHIEKARFNVAFYLAHYYRMDGQNLRALLQYAKSFFISPAGFFEKGKIKIGQMKSK